MKPPRLLLASFILSFTTFAAEESPADAKIRADIPLGGGLKPNPKVPAFVVVGHGARIITSKDDGKTWKQAFFAAPGADHRPWATKTVAYHGGVFVVGVGWGGPAIYLASDDGGKWSHLTHGTAKLPEAKGDARLMTAVCGLAGGKGAFVGGGFMTFTSTTDLGKAFDSFGMWGKFKDDPRGKLSTHHFWCEKAEDKSGDWKQQYVEHAKNFLDCVKSRKTPNSDLTSSHWLSTTCHLANISARTRREVVRDATTNDIAGDKEASTLLQRPYRAPWDAELKAVLA